MDPALLNRVLQGDPDAIEQFGESDHCVVVDWKDGLEDVVAAVAEFLPKDYLRVVSDKNIGPRLVRGDGTAIDASTTSSQQTEILLIVNQALAPKYQLRQFRPIDGDGYSLLAATTEFWAELERSQPKATERYFLTVERLAAYCRKGFVARLFSKP